MGGICIPNIKEVAQKAGLSVSCVSKYLNYPDHVLPETKEKIESAIAELNYTPSIIARSLRTKKTGIIVVVMESVINPFFGDLYDALRRNLEQYGYKAMLHTISNTDFSPNDFSFADGIVICFPDNDGIVSDIMAVAANIPKIVMHGHRIELDIPIVLVDVGLGIRLAAEHLYKQGCRHFLAVGGAKESSMSIEKTASLESYLNEKGTEVVFHVLHEENHYFGGIAAADQLVSQYKDIDAILCESDALATGVISRLLTLGYHIPEDIRVIGYDNIALAQMYRPAVTTIDIPIDKMSMAGAHMISDLIDGKTVGELSFYPVLVVRETG